MKKIIFILLLVVSIVSFSQTSFQCTKTIDTSNCKLRFFNANSVKIFELNLATTTYTRGVTNEYIIKDGLTQVTIPNNGCLTTPTFANLASFIDGARLACSSSGSSAVTFPTNLDTTQVDTSLINYLVQFDTSINRLDSILASIKRQSSVDTTHTAILQQIQDTLISKLSILDKSDIDTSLVQVIQLQQIIDSLSALISKSIQDTTHESILSSINAYMSRLDTTNVDTSLLTSTIIDRLDTLIALQIRDTITKSTDTLKALVFKPLTKNVSGTVDTLYNCKGLSFKANSTATGNLIVYYADGESDTYNVATEDLPFWDNSTFISFVGFDATGITGTLRINSVGCSQVETDICAKLKPILDCSSNTPIITCSGWQSGSGIWNSISGCWNTGQ